MTKLHGPFKYNLKLTWITGRGKQKMLNCKRVVQFSDKIARSGEPRNDQLVTGFNNIVFDVSSVSYREICSSPIL